MRKRYLITSAVILFVLNVPYLIAIVSTHPDYVFGGFLINPLDGNSYLAKMYQGWRGDWLFTLPYSAEPNFGALLFLFYLTLGHLSRWLSLSLVVMFHLARIFSSILFLASLRAFFRTVFSNRQQIAFWAFVFSILGSGLGWLAGLAGGFTSDFWVVEAFPFLSMYSSPHFTLGMAILVWFLSQTIRPFERKRIPLLIVGGLILGIVYPFGVVVAAVGSGGGAAIDLLQGSKMRWQAALAFLLTGGTAILYQFIVIRTDPVLAVWDRQNQTASPLVWDFVISFSPLFLIAIFGLVQAIRRRARDAYGLVAWFLLDLLLIYIPFNLQRRFMFAYMIPVAGLATYGLAEVKPKLRGPLGIGAISLALPTILIVVIGGVMAVKSNDALLVISRSEINAFEFVSQHAGPNDLILAASETGMLIPTYTGRRVIYGHPFETVNAASERQAVESFFSGPVNDASLDWARSRGVRWIFLGPRERQIGVEPGSLPAGLESAYENQDVKIYELREVP